MAGTTRDAQYVDRRYPRSNPLSEEKFQRVSHLENELHEQILHIIDTLNTKGWEGLLQ